MCIDYSVADYSAEKPDGVFETVACYYGNMKTAILLHGRPTRAQYFDQNTPSESNQHWFPWLQKQLLLAGVHAHTPEVHEPYAPKYENWAREIERYDVTPETILVGHSLGGGAVLRWLCEHPDVRAGRVVLVAPWIDVEKDDWPLFDFALDAHVAARTGGLTVFHSDDDFAELKSSVAKLQDTLLGATFVEFHTYGHFTADSSGAMKSTTFPELLAACLED